MWRQLRAKTENYNYFQNNNETSFTCSTQNVFRKRLMDISRQCTLKNLHLNIMSPQLLQWSSLASANMLSWDLSKSSAVLLAATQRDRYCQVMSQNRLQQIRGNECSWRWFCCRHENHGCIGRDGLLSFQHAKDCVEWIAEYKLTNFPIVSISERFPLSPSQGWKTHVPIGRYSSLCRQWPLLG